MLPHAIESALARLSQFIKAQQYAEAYAFFRSNILPDYVVANVQQAIRAGTVTEAIIAPLTRALAYSHAIISQAWSNRDEAQASLYASCIDCLPALPPKAQIAFYHQYAQVQEQFGTVQQAIDGYQRALYVLHGQLTYADAALSDDDPAYYRTQQILLKNALSCLAAKTTCTVRQRLLPTEATWAELTDFYARIQPALDCLLALEQFAAIAAIYINNAAQHEHFLTEVDARLHVAKQGEPSDASLRIIDLIETIEPIARQWHAHRQYTQARQCYQLLIQHTTPQLVSVETISRFQASVVATYDVTAEPSSSAADKPTLLTQLRRELQIAYQNFEAAFSKKDTALMTAQRTFSDAIQQWLGTIIQRCAQVLGPAPCGFAVLGTGAIVRKALSLCSDSDVMLLISDAAYRSHDYFQSLVYLIDITLRCLGTDAFHLDPGDVSYLRANGDMLDTPQGLAARYTPSEQTVASPEHYALRHTICLYTNEAGQTLHASYQTAIHKAWHDQSTSLCRAYLTEHERQFTCNQDASGQSTVALKEQFIIPLWLWCLDVTHYYEIQLPANMPFTFEHLIQALVADQRLNPGFAQQLTNTWCFVQRLRLRLHHAWRQHRWRYPALARDAIYLPDATEHGRPVPSGLMLTQTEWQHLNHVQMTLLPNAYAASRVFVLPNMDDMFQSFVHQCRMTAIRAREAVPQALQTLVIHLIHRQAPSTTHWTYYSQLPDAIKSHYIQCVRTTLQRYELTHTSSQYEIDAPLIIALMNYPYRDGSRPLFHANQHRWETRVRDQLTIPLPVNDATAVTLTWYTRTGECVSRALPKHYQDQLFTTYGTIKEEVYTALPGKRPVALLDNEDGSLMAYVKFYTELFGGHVASDRLSAALCGYGIHAVYAKLKHPQYAYPYPVLLSQPAGTSLQAYLQKHNSLGSFETQLDSYHFTQFVLASLVLTPEDDKGDNITVEVAQHSSGELHGRLVRVDSDHVLVPPIVKNWRGKEIVNCKSLVYCLKAMCQALDPQAVAEFLQLDAHLVLQRWLVELQQFNFHYVGQAAQRGLFSSDDITWLFREKSCFVPAVFEPGTVSGVYYKLRRIQTALLTHQPKDHFALFSMIEPRLAILYRAVCDVNATSEACFAALPTNYKVVHKDERVVYQSTFVARERAQRSLRALDIYKRRGIRQAIATGQFYGPKQVIQHELSQTHAQYQSIRSIRERFLCGDIEPFLNKDVVPYIREQVISSINYAALEGTPNYSVAQLQQRMVMAVKQAGGFHELHLRGLTAVSEPELLCMLKQSPDLHYLDVSECLHLTEGFFYRLAKLNLPLQILKMCRLNLVRLGRTSGRKKMVFPHLTRWILDGNQQLTVVAVTAPKLEEASFVNCRRLTNLHLHSNCLVKLDLDMYNSLAIIGLVDTESVYTLQQLSFGANNDKAPFCYLIEYPFLIQFIKEPERLAFYADLCGHLGGPGQKTSNLDKQFTSPERKRYRMGLLAVLTDSQFHTKEKECIKCKVIISCGCGSKTDRIAFLNWLEIGGSFLGRNEASIGMSIGMVSYVYGLQPFKLRFFSVPGRDAAGDLYEKHMKEANYLVYVIHPFRSTMLKRMEEQIQTLIKDASYYLPECMDTSGALFRKPKVILAVSFADQMDDVEKEQALTKLAEAKTLCATHDIEVIDYRLCSSKTGEGIDDELPKLICRNYIDHFTGKYSKLKEVHDSFLKIIAQRPFLPMTDKLKQTNNIYATQNIMQFFPGSDFFSKKPSGMDGRDLKIAFCNGNTGIGKASIFRRLSRGVFEPQDGTIIEGIYAAVTFACDNQRLFKLTLWDTPGQKRFRSIVYSTLANINFKYLIYVVGFRDPSWTIKDEIDVIVAYSSRNASTAGNLNVILVTSFLDTMDYAKRTATQEQLTRMQIILTKEHGVNVVGNILCSAKTGEGMDELLATIARNSWHDSFPIVDPQLIEDVRSVQSTTPSPSSPQFQFAIAP